MRLTADGKTSRVLIIAELGNNHEGDLALAHTMIEAAADAGVDVVKFQRMRPDRVAAASEPDRRAQLARYLLPDDAWRDLAATARGAGVAFMCTPFDVEGVEVLNEVAPAWKISSGDLTFYPLLDAVAETRKPVIMSTGMATLDEVRHSVARLRDSWGTEQPDLVVMHCVSCYPTAPEDASLGRIARLSAALDIEVGYSDHTLGTDIAAAAVALGATVIEKHFTMDKQQSDFRDHLLSADPDDLARLVRAIREVEAAVDGENDVAPCELAARSLVRRAVAAVREIGAGSVVRREDLTWLRGEGLPPGSEALVIGREALRPVGAGTILDAGDFGLDAW